MLTRIGIWTYSSEYLNVQPVLTTMRFVSVKTM